MAKPNKVLNFKQLYLSSITNKKIYITIGLFYLAVVGVLIGKQNGQSLEIMNPFDLIFTVMIIVRDYYNKKNSVK